MRAYRSSGECLRLPLKEAPEALFGAIAREPMSFFLDSALFDPRMGRWSFMGSRPFLVLRSRGRELTVTRGRTTRKVRGDPFSVLSRLLAAYRSEARGPVPPLLSGAVGFVSYEAGRLLERLRGARGPGRDIPDMVFGFYESVIACDLVRGEAWVARTGLRGDGHPGLAARQRARAAELASLLESPPRPQPPGAFALTAPLRSRMSRQAYLRAVASTRRAIAAGEIYQANLTRTFSAPWKGDPWALYLKLRRASPAPFASYLDFGGIRVVSSSMERLLKVSGSRVETRPIKGTRPRGAGAATDRSLALELVRSAKDSAEHMMIVDLERNDLGRVCEAGSVRVAETAALERYPQVFHLVSTVEGRLRRGLTAVDAFRAVFPGGSVIGAPKIRAEGILNALEPVPRGVYTGALGYFSFNGSCDFGLPIRTLTLTPHSASFGVGGGIVADSSPEAEYNETMDKARGMLMALGETRIPDRAAARAAVTRASPARAAARAAGRRRA